MTETFIPLRATVAVYDKVFQTSIMVRLENRAIKEEMGACHTAHILGYDNGETPIVANDQGIDPMRDTLWYDGDWTAPKKPRDGVRKS